MVWISHEQKSTTFSTLSETVDFHLQSFSFSLLTLGFYDKLVFDSTILKIASTFN